MDSCFLVCVSFALVAKDVTATLQQHGMGRPIIATTQSAALEELQAIEHRTDLRLAVVQMPPVLFAASPLQTVLRAMGVPVILLDDGPLPAEADMIYPILTIPFFTEDLERVLVAMSRPS